MALKLRYEFKTSVPVEIEGLVPEKLRELSLPEIEKFNVFHGNRKIPAGECFQISGNPSDERMEFEGDMAGVHWIGAAMSRGELHVAGNVGRHLGSEMSGGTITVDGDASDWVGGELHGGLIHVRGSAGHLVGAAYRGSSRGMTGGTILIGGRAGNEVGHTMRRGLIAVADACGDLVGFNMLAGTVLAFGDCGIRPGAGMKRGTLGLFGPAGVEVLPTFRRACRLRPLTLTMLLNELRRHAFQCDADQELREVDLYHGDLLEGGRGELWLAHQAA